MSVVTLVLTHYVFLLFFTCLSFVLGRRILRTIEFHSIWESVGFSIALGLGGIAYIVFFAGLLKLLYGWVLALILGALVAVAVITSPSFFIKTNIRNFAWRSFFTRLLSQKENIAFLGSKLLILGSSILLPLYPPLEWDAIEYHLSTAKVYMQSNAVVVTQYLRYPVFTQLNNMLFTLMLLFSDDLSAQLVQYLFYLLVGVLIYAYSRRHFSHRIGILAVVLWYSNLLAIWASHVATIDMGLVFFGTAGVFAFLNFYKARQWQWLVLAGVLLGFAAAVKYTALFWVALCGLFTLWIALRERKWHIPFIFALVTMLFACPFYIRNFYYTGNPFFPYISLFFKENIWTNVDFQLLSSEQRSYGLPVSLVNFIKLPWYLKVSPRQFNNGFPPYNWFYLAFLPATLLVAFIKPYLRHLLIFSMSFTVFWFLTPQVMRYLFPVFPFFCLLSAVAFDNLLTAGMFFLQRMTAWRLPGWLPSLVYWMVILPTALNVSFVNLRTVRELGVPPTTLEERDAFLQRHLPSYAAYQMLNSSPNGKNYRIYALLDENMSYYADGIFMGDWFGQGRYSTVTNALSKSQELYQVLRKLEAQYFLFNENRAHGLSLPADSLFDEKFRKIYDSEGVKLFEIQSP